MLKLSDIRDYISSLGISADENTYIGKLDAKKAKSIGIYNRRQERSLRVPIGGLEFSGYEIKSISFLVHWTKSYTESETAAYAFFEKLKEQVGRIGNERIFFSRLMVEHPIDVGTDDNGIYEFVIWLDFIYERED